MAEDKTTEQAPRQLATAADFLKSYKTEEIRVEEGLLIQIRSLPQADMLIGFGGMLALKMGQAGKDFEDDQARREFIDGLDAAETKQLLVAQRDGIKENVCKAVESLHVTMKPQSACGENELSIDSLSTPTVWLLWRRVRVLSGLSDPGEAIMQGFEE